ncbi:MAG: glycogen synthase [Planctomycetes bacterium]|nr:glycogen synthase [Planctomycetota bacterium]
MVSPETSLKVAVVTPELQSLVLRTNLAGVAESLAAALRAQGADARVFLPLHKGLELSKLQQVQPVAELSVKDGRAKDGQQPIQRFKVLQGRLPLAKGATGNARELPVYLFDQPVLFGTRQPYSGEEGPYPDNWRRYALFSRAVLESLPALGFEPEVIHCLDWTTGLLPLFHQVEYVERELDHPAARAGTFFGIHNLALQGVFEREILPHVGIPHSYFRSVRGVELAGKVNYLKAGAEFATIIGTHSPTHAQKIQQRDRGYGLEEVFHRRSKELIGITNGIDYQAWDPSNDPALPAAFSARDRELAGKKKCKAVLQQKLGLDTGARTPLACCIGRWDADGGIDLLAEILTPILERGLELVVMGTGSPEIQQRLKTMEGTFMGRCRVIDGYQVNVAHLVMAGSDLLVLPSHYQPSNPLFAIGLRYGVAPVLYARSGLEDIVPDFATNPRQGLGFHFENYSGDGLLSGIDNALKAYKSPATWKTLSRRCLAKDFSWASTADEYLKLYRRVTRRAKARQEAE